MIVSVERKGIARRIERGDYAVDAHKVADAILRRPELARAFGSMLVAREVHGAPVAAQKRQPGAGVDPS
jgi:hypothetical protein